MPFDASRHDGGPLFQAAMENLMAFFADRDHRPSQEQWRAIGDLARHIEKMADGELPPRLYLSSLDPGVGKTRTVCACVDALLSFTPEYSDVGVMICVSTLSEVEKLIEAMAVPDHSVCVMTSDKRLNELGVGVENADRAQVIITTQQRIEHHLQGKRFNEAAQFFFRGKPRQVRIWDEAYLPGRTVTLTGDDIAFLFKPLRTRFHGLAEALTDLFEHLRRVEDGTLMQLPDFITDHDVDLNAVLSLFDEHRSASDKAIKDDQRDAITSLWMVSGKTVTIRRDGYYGNTLIDFKDTLPEDLAPMIITDASGRVRETYDQMARGRENLIHLRSGPKRYDNLTIHVWQRGGGKSAFQAHGSKLIEGMAATICEHPDDKWLVITHKKDRNVGDVAGGIQEAMTGPADVSFLTWGNHKATNDHVNCRRLILGGTLFYRASYYESLARLALNRKASEGDVTKAERERTQMGEHRHLILQALCRGAVRKSEGDSCHPMDAYMICSVRSGIKDALSDIFPGCRIVEWKPIPDDLRGNAKRAFYYIVSWFDYAEPGESLTFRKVAKELGISAQSFKNHVRYLDAFKEALAAEGIVEHGKGQYMTGYRLVSDID